MTSYLPFIFGSRGVENRIGIVEYYIQNDKYVEIIDGEENKSKFESKLSLDPPPTQKIIDISMNHSITKLVYMDDIPSYMIPCDILNYLSIFFDSIISVQILRQYTSPEKYFGLILLDTIASAQLFVNHYHHQTITSLEPTVCNTYYVSKVYFTIDHLEDQLKQSIIETNKIVAKNLITGGCSESKSSVDEKSSFSRDNIISYNLDNFDNNNEIITSDEHCALCLEAISKISPHSFTSACNHIFHINCITKLEGPLCPVCRFQHDYNELEYTECSLCGWQGNHSYNHTDSRSNNSNDNEDNDLWVCLICGFVGCGCTQSNHIRSHYEAHMHTYAMNTETRMTWDFAGDGYVHRLLLMKPDMEFEEDFDISMYTSSLDASSETLPPPPPSSKLFNNLESDYVSPRQTNQLHNIYNRSSSNNIDNSSVSYFPLQVSSSNTEGDRLGMRTIDRRSSFPDSGSGSGSGSGSTGGLKIVEGFGRQDNANGSGDGLSKARSPFDIPMTMSSVEYDRQSYSMKLDSMSQHYNNLLAWHLSQQRAKYERDLNRIKARHQISLRNDINAGKSLGKVLVQSLAAEKLRLTKTMETVNCRLSKLQEEKQTLLEFNSHLLKNKSELQVHTRKAMNELDDAEKHYRCTVSKLNLDIARMMTNLDQSSSSSGHFHTASDSNINRRVDANSTSTTNIPTDGGAINQPSNT